MKNFNVIQTNSFEVGFGSKRKSLSFLLMEDSIYLKGKNDNLLKCKILKTYPNGYAFVSCEGQDYSIYPSVNNPGEVYASEIVSLEFEEDGTAKCCSDWWLTRDGNGNDMRKVCYFEVDPNGVEKEIYTVHIDKLEEASELPNPCCPQ